MKATENADRPATAPAGAMSASALLRSIGLEGRTSVSLAEYAALEGRSVGAIYADIRRNKLPVPTHQHGTGGAHRIRVADLLVASAQTV
jgi:hypothetical protein